MWVFLVFSQPIFGLLRGRLIFVLMWFLSLGRGARAVIGLVSKTSGLEPQGFESLPLRHTKIVNKAFFKHILVIETILIEP